MVHTTATVNTYDNHMIAIIFSSGNMVIGLTGIKITILDRKRLQEIRPQNNCVETLDQHIKMVLTFDSLTRSIMKHAEI